MKFVVQRVSNASVTVEDMVCGKIDKGFMVLIGIGQMDDEAVADKMVQKLINMRIFEEEWQDKFGTQRCRGTIVIDFPVYTLC